MLFREHCLRLALMGYTKSHQVPETRLHQVAQAWIIEYGDLEEREPQHAFTRSFVAEVMDRTDFHLDCNTLLALASHLDPPVLAAKLMHSNVTPIRRQPRPVAYPTGGPAA